jgi:protein ImuB
MNAALAANELRLTIKLEVRRIQNDKKDKDEEQYEHNWKLPFPTQDKNLLFGLVRLQLEKTTFSAPIRKLTAEVIPVKPRIAQSNLFAPPSPEPEKLELTLERIRGVVGSTDSDGAACVGSPCLVDTHRPGSFALQSFSAIDNTEVHCHPERGRPMRKAHRSAESKDPYFCTKSKEFPPVIALRVFRPTLETSVELDHQTPHFVRLWNRHRQVLAASGPWSTSGNWWNAPWAREEWDVALKTPAGIGFYRIYRDRIRQQWFVEGVFD